MLAHSSQTAKLDPGKDGGRREQEQGSRGEAGWGCRLGGIQREVRKGILDNSCVCVCVCTCFGFFFCQDPFG